jgi:hypothetical protein
MFHHDTESRLLLARERAELLANDRWAGPLETESLGDSARRFALGLPRERRGARRGRISSLVVSSRASRP